jgi:hypothetical protein
MRRVQALKSMLYVQNMAIPGLVKVILKNTRTQHSQETVIRFKKFNPFILVKVLLMGKAGKLIKPIQDISILGADDYTVSSENKRGAKRRSTILPAVQLEFCHGRTPLCNMVLTFLAESRELESQSD